MYLRHSMNIAVKRLAIRDRRAPVPYRLHTVQSAITVITMDRPLLCSIFTAQRIEHLTVVFLG